MGHYYKENGDAMHHVRMTSDSSKFRPTRITDARKLGLIPSVTTVWSILEKEGLNNWKIGQAIEICYETEDCKDLDAYKRVVTSKLKNRLDEAPNLGSNIHAAIELYLDRGGKLDHAYKEYINAVLLNLSKRDYEIVKCEQTIAKKELGYAGTVDLIVNLNGVRTVVDFKTCNSIPKKPKEGHAEQVAAYMKLCGAEAGINLYLSTSQPGESFEYIYTQKEMKKAWKRFSACLDMWTLLKDYDPRKE